jgi:hypothetical protein
MKRVPRTTGVEPRQRTTAYLLAACWKDVSYDRERFVRTDKEDIVTSVAEKLIPELNYQFADTSRTRGARN